MTAAMVLAASKKEEDSAAAERVLTRLVSDTRASTAPIRRDFAIAIRHVPYLHFQRLLIPLMNDASVEVAEEAMRTIRKLGATDSIFVPKLISLLHHRYLRSGARELLVEYGPAVLEILKHFMRDPEEDIRVRRHIPAAIARIPCQKAMDILVDALGESDGYLRFNVIASLERLHRTQPQLTFRREPIEALLFQQSERYFNCAAIRRKLLEEGSLSQDSLLSRAVAERISRIIDRIYRLLGLLYPWKDVAAARYSIEHDDARSRAGALEYLDQLLSAPLRRHLIPLLEGAPPDESPAGLRSELCSFEEVVLRLINDEDPVLSAAAVYLVGQRRMPGLLNDLERVLATRDVRDWYVFEAASWVLASYRMSDVRRRALWCEPLPAVEVAEQLRRLPLFRSVPINELFRIAGAGRQLRCEAGRQLHREDSVPDSLLFLLDGSVCSGTHGDASTAIHAPAALGFREVLASEPMRNSIRAREATVCLALSSEECRTLLGDDIDLLDGIFRLLCQSEAGSSTGLVLKASPALSPPPTNGDLKLIEKVLTLRTIPIFSEVTAEEMVNLASIATESHLEPSSPLFVAADAPALFAMVSGELSLGPSRDEPEITAGPGDLVGVYQTLSGLPFDRPARVVREGVALRIDREDLFDLLSQRPNALRQIFSSLLRTGGLNESEDSATSSAAHG
jgi:CRP-like cAMP-binding protein